MTTLVNLGTEQVLRYDTDGPIIDSEQRAADLIGDAMSEGATLIAVPVSRLAPEFFQLRSGLAGMMAQKFVNYRLKFAIVGDIAEHLEASNALRDWVRECNRGRDIYFVPTFDDLAARLGTTATPR